MELSSGRIKSVLIDEGERVEASGFYPLPLLNKNDNLPVRFRIWRNANTGETAEGLTQAF